MRRRKHRKGLKYPAVVLAVAVALCVAAFLYLKKNEIAAPPPSAKASTGYKMEDRLKLEKLINQGAKSD